MAWILSIGLALAAAWPASAGASVGPGAEARWVPAPEPTGPVVALAYAPARDDSAALPRIAVADAGGVWVGTTSGRLAPVHRAHGIRELTFAPDGSLWIASAEGLWRWHEGGSSRPWAARPGAGARDVHRIRAAGDLRLAASEDGVHLSRAGEAWRRLPFPVPAGPATALAVGRNADEVRVGVVVDGVAHWLVLPLEGSPDASGAGSGRVVRVGSPGEGRRSAADVWIARDGAEAWTLLRNGCVVGPERVCPALPPGAEARRLFHAADRYWLATERGLLVAETPAGPWRREAPPLGSLSTHAVAGGPHALFVGTDRGLHVARAPSGPAAGAVADVPAAFFGEHGEPSVAEVRRAALAYLDLGAGRLRQMRRGAERRGWLPTLAFRLDRDQGVDRRTDHDEAYISGGLRSLFDREEDRSTGLEASLELEWDLGDVLHHPESVDVSREVRELVELRDDVLDEIHHLYYERRRVLLELLALPPDRPLEAARLRLRADELAAGIDAWTGGWFGRHAIGLAP